MLGVSSSGSTLLMDLMDMDNRGRAVVVWTSSLGSSDASSGSVVLRADGSCCSSSSCCCSCSSFCWGASAITTVLLCERSSLLYQCQTFSSLSVGSALTSVCSSCCGERERDRGIDELDSRTHRWAPLSHFSLFFLSSVSRRRMDEDQGIINSTCFLWGYFLFCNSSLSAVTWDWSNRRVKDIVFEFFSFFCPSSVSLHSHNLSQEFKKMLKLTTEKSHFKLIHYKIVISWLFFFLHISIKF